MTKKEKQEIEMLGDSLKGIIKQLQDNFDRNTYNYKNDLCCSFLDILEDYEYDIYDKSNMAHINYKLSMIGDDNEFCDEKALEDEFEGRKPKLDIIELKNHILQAIAYTKQYLKEN